MKFTPYPHQARLIDRFIADRHVAGAVDMGLGKTGAVLTAYIKLLRAGKVRGMLVLAPVRVCETTWPDEIVKWNHTTILSWSNVRGNPASKTMRRPDLSAEGCRLLGLPDTIQTKESEGALEALSVGFDVYLANYEILPALCTWMAKQNELPFDMLVVDESTKMKSPKSKGFKALKKLLHRFKRRITLTGTDAPNSYYDLWSQYYILDKGERLGDHVTYFSDRFFTTNPWTHERKMHPGADVKIQEMIKDITVCMRSEDYLKLPAMITNIVKVKMPPKAERVYREFEKEMVAELKGETLVAKSAATLSMKCRQLTSGAIYSDDKTWTPVHDAKLDAVEDLLDDAGAEGVLVVYEFRHEVERLLKRWPKTPWIGGGSKGADDYIRQWNAKKINRMFVHPASVGHGTNLQYGGRTMVWTSGTWSYDLWAQMLKRLHRPGQTKAVTSHLLVCPNTIDEAVQATILEKHTSQVDLLNALKEVIRA